MQVEITRPSNLLDSQGGLIQVGWSRTPLLDCNLEKVHFYAIRPLQKFRIKRWDYYAFFTPQRFFSATIADLGYTGNIFVYTLDFETLQLHEEELIVPLGKGIQLPRSSNQGESCFENQQVSLRFQVRKGYRQISVSWPGFNDGHGLRADISLYAPPDHESMNIVIPMEGKRFYYNRKINCLPAEGYIQYGEEREVLHPHESLGSLDWGRGVWVYRSFWNWASASGFLPDGDAIGLNLGQGFGNTSAATENCLVLNGRIHKLDDVGFLYDPHDYHKPWHFADSQGRLELEFVPFSERVARTNLGIIFSEVHQMFGRYSGRVETDGGESILLDGLVGFAEEHRARW